MDNCPVCNAPLIRPDGPSGSAILIAGGIPSDNDLRRRTPYVDLAGSVLEKEMKRAGISIRACRRTYLWKHAPQKGGKANAQKAQCFEWLYEQFIQELSTAKVVLMFGPDLSDLFFGRSVIHTSGMCMASSYAPPSVEYIVPSYNPTIALGEGGIGELRHAIQVFATYAKPIYEEMLHG